MGKRKANDTKSELPVARFTFRLSSIDPEDIRLSNMMAADIESGAINLSVVTRTLLLRWYEWRQMSGELSVPGFMSLNVNGTTDGAGGGNTARHAAEKMEDPNDALVQRLAGMSATDWT